MANPFTITTAADAVRLDSQGRGSTTFTVSNRSGQLRRGRARLVPSDPGQASWLSVDGEAERNFTADGTQQYTVRVAPPPGAPVGRYTFGLDVVSVENPDEEWSQGPKVAFEVGPSQPARKPFPWWIVVVAAAVLLVGGLAAWLMSRGDDKPAPQPVHISGVLETCRQDSDCDANLTCAIDIPGQPGICVGKAGFSPCGSNRACAEGLVCDHGTCQTAKVAETPPAQETAPVEITPPEPAAKEILIPAKDYAAASPSLKVGGSGTHLPNVVYDSSDLGNPTLDNQDRYLEYDVSFPKGGPYELWVEYLAFDSRPVIISLDGKTVQEQGMAVPTGGTFRVEDLKWRFQAGVQVDAGTHGLRLFRNGPFPAIRNIKFVPKAP
jgi:hypothetical protein